MTSKLDYLQKYLAKPSQDTTDAARLKEKKKKKKGERSAATLSHDSMRIRDMSEVLPSAREVGQKNEFLSAKQAKLLSLSLDEDEARLARDGELDFVEEEELEAAKRASVVDVDKSGVKWKISNHMKKPSKQALRGRSDVKAEVVKEEVKREASDEDLSPPRSQPKPAAAKTMARPRNDSDADLSPPRAPAAATAPKTRHDSDDDLSPPRQAPKAAPAAARKRHDSDDDLSPPRQAPQAAPAAAKKRHDSDEDLSPPRQAPSAAPAARKRHDSDEDLSPPRQAPKAAAAKKRHDSDEDLSPPRQAPAKKQRHDSDADLSPPRKGKDEVKKEADADLSPPRKDSAVKGQRHDSDADLSPPRKSAASSSKDAPSKSRRHDSDADLSPPRKSSGSKRARHDSDADLSPPRKGKDDEEKSYKDAPEKMSSGLNAGLISGKALKDESDRVKRERKEQLAAMPDEQTGKGADTVYRSRKGGTIDRAQWVEEQKKTRKKKLSEYPEQELAWGGGYKQGSNAEELKAEAERVAALPFARYEAEESAIKDLQDRQSWNDPMRQFKDDDEAAASGSSAAAKPQAPKPKCPHPPWPNRFNIPPGYRWDGAVRGNGYEKRWLQAKNNRAFNKTEQYKWERLED